MPSLLKTAFLELSKWAGNEYPKREDFVSDNEKIDAFADDISSQMAQKVSKTGDTMTGNLAVPTINSKTPAYAITPVETLTITSGFAAGWSGAIKVHKTQEGILIYDIQSLAKSSAISANEVVYTFPLFWRPATGVQNVVVGQNTVTGVIAGSVVELLIESGGALSARNLGSVTANVNFTLRHRILTL